MRRSTQELVAVALGWRTCDTDRAASLLEHVGGLRGLLAGEAGALVAAGARERQAERVVALLELVGRRDEGLVHQVSSPADVERLVGPELRLALEERLVVLCLDRRNRVLAKVTVTVGSASFTIVDPAQIYGLALRHHAAAIVLAHNHPSGDPTPSVQDREVTQRVAAAGRLLGIPLIDHVVVGASEVRSMGELGDVPTYSSAQASWAA